MQKIVPNLWFDDQAEDAAQFYVSLFANSTMGAVSRYGKEGFEIHGQPEGRAMTAQFELSGYRLLALNGGPHFKFTPAISLFVVHETEAEVDALWAGLSEGGTVLMPLQGYEWSGKYGWLNDRYGLSWQIMLGRHEDVGQTITPSLLFVGAQHGRAEEAISHYISVFSNSGIDGIHRYGRGGIDPEGTIKHAQFRLNGEAFMAMDSAARHGYGFTEAISFVVHCDTQDEIDRYWQALSAVPEAEECGWLKDRFGVSWQVVPGVLPNMLMDPDREKVERVIHACMQTKKFDLAALQKAYAG
jgi:predicted 3-demethylubiquinone-9 3-methyltransferase (glyoxalase superfamily)